MIMAGLRASVYETRSPPLAEHASQVQHLTDVGGAGHDSGASRRSGEALSSMEQLPSDSTGGMTVSQDGECSCGSTAWGMLHAKQRLRCTACQHADLI